jgi:hypothetical protein
MLYEEMMLLLASGRKDSKSITNEDLYQSQMAMLKGFLDRGAISREQYDHSAKVLTEKIPHWKT